MILFDWFKVKLVGKRKVDNIINIMHAITWPNELPSKKARRINPYFDIDFSGHSYLLNPESLLERRDIPASKIVEYIELASRRSYAEYLLTRDRTLDYRLVNRPIENELITTINNRVVFNYE